MILSYHPCFIGNQNRLCAGRDPDVSDLEIIRAADAVILPPGCRPLLFEMANTHCPRVFPDYRARFAYPGKTGQARLFAETRMPHPESLSFDCLDDFYACTTSITPDRPPFGYPFVFKFSWSGEGANVWRIDTGEQFEKLLEKAAVFERSGQSGFVLQRHVKTGERSLRVVVIGAECRSYWRIQPDPGRFGTGLAEGAVIDSDADPDLQEAGRRLVLRFCESTGINLAGFDLIFDTEAGGTPLLLEINYYFGRRGLGGSDRFYRLLEAEIHQWLYRHNLKV